MNGADTGYPGLNYETLNVGIGEYKVARSPARIRTVLGSCVGVIIYDAVEKVGGIAHVYLPYTYEFRNSPSLEASGTRFSFADLLIPHMLDALLSMNGCYTRFKAYLTGGAYMLKSIYNADIDIGKKNLIASRDILKIKGIPVRELSVGGDSGQTVFFNLFDGGIDVKIHDKIKQL